MVVILNYREIVDYIEEIPKFTSKNPLDHTKALLKRLGDPQNQMQVIHVAGTNGKEASARTWTPCSGQEATKLVYLLRRIW